MITLEQVDPTSDEHLERYRTMLSRAARVAEVRDHLPEIFEEGSRWRVQQGIREMGALRYFVRAEGQDVGRLELNRSLSHDTSVVTRAPEGLSLGFNTCYFINPAIVTRNLELAHQVVADMSIRKAFFEGDEQAGLAPWLPVSLDGDDVSRGWLLQGENPWFDVRQTEPQKGFFPQYGIGHYPYSLVTAIPKQIEK